MSCVYYSTYDYELVVIGNFMWVILTNFGWTRFKYLCAENNQNNIIYSNHVNTFKYSLCKRKKRGSQGSACTKPLTHLPAHVSLLVNTSKRAGKSAVCWGGLRDDAIFPTRFPVVLRLLLHVSCIKRILGSLSQ